MSELFAISRIENYKYSDCGGVLKEALRTLPNYDNPDCDPSRSHLNYSFVTYDSSLTIEKYIVDYREKNNIKGRFNLNTQNKKNATNVMSQALFTASPEYLKDMSRDDIISFYRNCYEFFKSEFPDVPIISAVIHFDERTPHMHLTFLPIVSRINKKTKNKEKIFSTTLLMPGKDFFPKYQDRFYKFISEKYDGLSRKNKDGIDREHMTVKEYKKFKELIAPYEEKIKELSAEVDVLKERSRRLEQLERLPIIGYLFEIINAKTNRQRIQAINDTISALQDGLHDINSGLENTDVLADKIALAESQKAPESRLKSIVKNIKELF